MISDFHKKSRKLVIALSLWLVMDTSGLAMMPLDDSELSEENGAGLAFPFNDFSLQMANTSFIELTGDAPDPAKTTFVRGDLRYYGLSLTNGVNLTGVDWAGAACTTGFSGLGCPRSNNTIGNYSAFDNPFVMRTFNQNQYGTNNLPDLQDRTVLEIIGPSDMDPFRWAFYGEIESGRNGASNSCAAGSTLAACLLKTQNIILGKPASRLKPVSIGGSSDATNPYSGPIVRLMQYMGTTGDAGADPKTYGVTYDSRLSGDYRLSVNTVAADAGVRGVIPSFTTEEGMYFKNVQAYLPLGQLHYQAMVFDDAQPGSTGTSITNGNIAIVTTRIPNQADAYKDFYSFKDGTVGSANSGYDRAHPDRYYQTHGYIEWGDKFPINTNPNGLGGSGVSTVRFAGVDPDGPTQALNATNFPAATFITGSGTTTRTVTYNGVNYTIQSAGLGSGSPAPSNPINCADGKTTCTYSGVTVGNSFTGTINTREEVVAAGGMVFVSRDPNSTWTVLNNQNLPEGTADNMLWIANTTSTPAANTSWTYSYQLQRDARYPAADYNAKIKVNAINLGHSRILGMSINHMRIETLGGN